ncbi:MAG: SDR family NAD(P)-dependent oxidoreductase [Gemmataceae bacterium]
MALAGKVAVVTGASSGIGWELAKELAGRGCRLGLLARRRERLETLAEEIRAQGGSAAVAVADVAEHPATITAIHALAEQLGPIDLLVANAGIGSTTHIDPFDAAETERLFRINFFGMVHAIEAVLPDMLRRRTGHLVGISSLAGLRGLPAESAYCSSKAAQAVYLEGLRVQLRPYQIKVTTICPGFIRTPMTAKARFPLLWALDADVAARRIVRAIERGKKVYRFPWQMTLLMRLACVAPDFVVGKLVQGLWGE